MILVTGSTGAVGGRVARLLAERDVPLRLLVRDAARAPQLAAEVAVGEYADTEALRRALRGVRTLFLVSGYGEPMKRALLHKNAIEAAAEAGVGHIVYTSFQSAGPDSAFPYGRDHFETEQYLEQSGVAFSALRDNLYQEIIPELVDDQGRIRGPAGEGRVAWVARDDVARVAAELLLAPPARSDRYVLTGPESLTLAETAERVARLWGRAVRYESETIAEGRQWRGQLGAEPWEIEVWLGSFVAIAAGELAQLSGAVRDITGREPRALADTLAAAPAD